MSAARATLRLLIAADAFFEDDPGGAARVPWEIARHLTRRGHRVQLCVRGRAGRPAQETRDGVLVRRYPWSPWNPLFSLWNARRLLQQTLFPLDAVHVHSPFTGLALELAGTFKNVPKIAFFHSPWAAEYLIRRRFAGFVGPAQLLAARIRMGLERRVLSRADRIVTLSRYMSNELRKTHRVAAEKTTQLRGGADVERFNPALPANEARARLGWPREGTILLTVRNLEARMGLENLIAAMPALRRRDPSLRLYLVGDGSLRGYLEQGRRRLRLEEAVTFLGLVSEETLRLCYQAADVFMLPTRELEGFGLVTVEALASGCPVIGTQVGATAEILKPLDASLLATGTSAQDLQTAIDRFLARRKDWPALRTRCAQYARQQYSWEAVSLDVEKLTEALAK